jgi:hypothetical protein
MFDSPRWKKAFKYVVCIGCLYTIDCIFVGLLGTDPDVPWYEKGLYAKFGTGFTFLCLVVFTVKLIFDDDAPTPEKRDDDNSNEKGIVGKSGQTESEENK